MKPASVSYCDRVSANDVVPRFLAGTLSATEREAFESHFLTCERCQQELELGATIRGALQSEPVIAPARPATRPNSRWFLAAGLAAAAVIAFVMRPAGGRENDGLASLGRVIQAPVYLGVAVRATDDAAGDQLFELGMRAYAAERFQAAADTLQLAIAAGVSGPPAPFFLGASELMLGRPRAAVQSFARVIAMGDTPYLAESHYYRAKSQLQLGRRTEALGDLVAAEVGNAALASQARALADSIRGIQR